MAMACGEKNDLQSRVVTLTVGQLTDALAEALKVVSDAEPRWKKGDRAYVEVDVTGGDDEHVNVVPVGSRRRRSFGLPASSLVGVL